MSSTMSPNLGKKLLPTEVAAMARPFTVRIECYGTPPSPPPPPQSQSPSGIVTTVTDNLMLRRDPDPSSPSVLEGLYPDHIPAGQHFSFESLSHASQACTRIYSGKFWCPLTYNASDGRTRKGWVNAYHLALNDGTRLACELDGSSGQIPECHIYLRGPLQSRRYR